MPRRKSPRIHVPNAYSEWEIVRSALFSLLLVAYAGYSVFVGEAFVPGRHQGGMSMTGIALAFGIAGMLCGAANLVALIVDHFDRRDNEAMYRRFRFRTQVAGWTLFLGGMFIEMSD